MSKRLIDADKLLEDLRLKEKIKMEEYGDYCWNAAIEEAKRLVREAQRVVAEPDMTPEMEQAILLRAIERWGEQAQSDQCVQEMAELTQAIMKIRQLSYAPHTEQVTALENLVEEIADVEIMIDQMKMIYGAADVRAQREKKLARLEERLEKLDKEVKL